MSELTIPAVFGGEGELVFQSDWVAAQTVAGDYVIALADTITEENQGRGAAVICMCPSFPIANYIAHAHNLLKVDVLKMQEIVDHVAAEEPKVPQGKPDTRPDETGGYL